jgi:3-oxoacyl-[acyl-carrier-protein] synthase III
MTRVGIRHLSFTLGDQKVWYRDLPEVDELIQELNIPDEEDLWSWGFCQCSPSDYSTHIARGFAGLAGYLATEGVTVDAVIGCSPFQNSPQEFLAALISEVLPKVAVDRDRLHLVEDRECVNVLQALAEAKRLVRAGHGHVLILAAEKVEQECRRFRKYSLFSDFCLALLVSGHIEHCAYEVGDMLIRADSAPAEDTGGILTRDLERECISSLLAANGLAMDAVGKFFYLNLFQPIAEMKAREVGCASAQLYTSLAREIGHCSGADPFINLHTYFATGGDAPTHLLCASGREYAGGAIMHRLRDDHADR